MATAKQPAAGDKPKAVPFDPSANHTPDPAQLIEIAPGVVGGGDSIFGEQQTPVQQFINPVTGAVDHEADFLYIGETDS